MLTTIGIAGTAKNTGKTTTLNALLHYAQSGARSTNDAPSMSFRAAEGGEKSASAQETQSGFLTSPARSRNSDGFGMTTGVTSIGYDGEEIDNITLLPKPRIFLNRGMIASTSSQCVPENGWSVLYKTGLFTALGEIVIVRCETPGLIVLAGPNKRSELETVVRQMADLGCENIFVDGALNRIAPMSIVDKIIFTTGAARTTDIATLVDEMKAIESLFGIGRTKWTKSILKAEGHCEGAQRPKQSPEFTRKTRLLRQTTARNDNDLEFLRWPPNKQEKPPINVILSEANLPAGQAGNPDFSAGNSTGTIIDATEAEIILQHYKIMCYVRRGGYPLHIDGLITSNGLRTLVERIHLLPDAERPQEIIFADPITMLLSGEPKTTAQLLSHLIEKNITISYQKPIQLAAITVNPFYPECRGTTYTSAYVDAKVLISRMKQSLETPTFDTMRNEVSELNRCIK
ncbi:MAG: hypothetical protein HYV29_09200 [Ignavibacteriales bacterium]|nr:hypothetical protein [Ignavibacteriales bacterium]